MSFTDSFQPLGNLGLHGVVLPKIEIDKKYYRELGLSDSASSRDFLKALCIKGIKEKEIDKRPDHQVYLDRVNKELGVLDRLAFTDYILLIWDIVRFCNEKGIATGVGRGCNHPDNLIVVKGKAGPICKAIKNVLIGDTVYNRLGKETKVKNVLKYECDEDLVEFTVTHPSGLTSDAISLTKDHEVYALRRGVKPNGVFREGDFVWKKAEDVRRRDWLVSSSRTGRPTFSEVLNKSRVKNIYEFVYDLSVEGDPSYHTSDFIVHNSAAGSEVTYLTGLTKVDAIRHNLIFERFISAERASEKIINGKKYLTEVPDFDLDVDFYRREEVINYVKSKFKGRTCKIMTVSTLSGKLALKEVVKTTINATEEKSKELADYVDKVAGFVDSLEKTEEKSEGMRNWLAEPHSKGVFMSNRDAYEIAKKLEDLPKNFGIHPSAIVVSEGSLKESLPYSYSKSTDGSGLERWEEVSNVDMNWVNKYAVKVDVLGLRNVSVVDDVLKQTGLKFDDIDFDDPSLYEPLQNLKTPHGLFQIEASVMSGACQRIKPNSLNELSDLMAIARPGALAEIDGYIEAKESGKIEKVEERWDKILAESKGMILYQESQMRLLHDIFGFSLIDANTLRKVIGKKQRDKMPEWKGKIFEAAKRLGVSEDLAQKYWDSVNASASYSFNRCLSPNTIVLTRDRGPQPMKNVEIGEEVLAYETSTGKDIYVKVINKIESKETLYKHSFSSGSRVECSVQHKFLCSDNVMRSTFQIFFKDLRVKTKGGQLAKIKSIELVGSRDTLDFEVDHKDHNFYAEELVTSNSHSVAYATLAAATVYLKFNHPQQFFLSLLKMTKYEPKPHEEISKISKELHYFGMRLLPPDLLKSDLDFKIEGRDIRYGLTSIKNIAGKAAEKLPAFRTEHSNKFELFQSARQAGLNIGALSSLIQAGALNSLTDRRSYSVLEAQTFNKLSDREKRYVLMFGEKHNFDLFKILKTLVAEQTKDEGGKREIIKQSRYDTIQKACDDYLKIYRQNAKNERLANWYFEKKMLGYSYGDTLFDVFKDSNRALIPLSDFDVREDNDTIISVACVVEAKESIAKKTKKQMLKMIVEDGNKTLTVIMFDKSLEKWKQQQMRDFGSVTMPKEGNLVTIVGRKSRDIAFLDKMTIMDFAVYIKLSDLKDDVS